MRTKSLIKTADSGGKAKAARRKASRRRRTGAPSAHGSSTMPPLQWWRHLSADAYTDAHLRTLHRAISGIGMIGEPRWADAARGEPAAAVGVALRTINNRRSLKPIVDLTMSTVLIAALNGSAAAITLLTLMIGRMAATNAESQRLQRSWIEVNRAGRNPAAAGSAKRRRG